MTVPPAPGLAWINTTEESAVAAAFHQVCAVPAWGRRLLDRRPFQDTDALCTAGDAATAGLTEAELDLALAAHPPIGRPAPSDPLSAGEQRGAADASAELRRRLHELNLAYQERFGHVFLICATGLTGEQLLRALCRRLDSPRETERRTVRSELGKINRIRLTRLAQEGSLG